MKKRFTKLFAALALLAFFIPSMIAVGQSKENVTYTLTINGSDFNTTSYAANNNEKTSNAVCTTDNTKTYEVKWTSNQVMKNGNNMQWQKDNGYIYNSTNLGTISSVTVNSSAGSFTTYYGTSEHPTSGTTVGNGFFTTKVGKAKGTTSSVVITFIISEGGSSLLPNDLTLNVSEKEFDLADGEGQTFQLTNSGSADGTISYATNNGAVATVSNSGLITAIDEGTATITVTQAPSSTYEGGTATCTVTVTDSRYEISNLTFTAACGGSGTANDGAVWTVTSDGTESNFDSTSGIHYGTNNASVTYLQLATSDINGTIKKVVVNTRDAQATASVTVTVGGTSFYCGENTSVTATNTSTDYTFTGTGSGEIVVRIDRGSSMSKAIYVKSVKVYYIPSNDPSITASDLNIAYDAANGAIEYTLQNGTGNVSATIATGDWLTLGTITSSTVPFTCSANPGNTARTATVTLSYSGASDKVVTITQAANPNLANIGALTAQTDGSYTVSLTDALVTYTNGTNAYLEDASGAVLLYHCNDNNLNLAVGDKITGTANVTYTVYNNLPEVTAFTLATGYTLTSGNIVTPAVVTIADLESNYTSYISRYVKIENATVTSAFSNKNCTIEQNSSSIVLRDQNSSATLETTQGDIVTVTAHPSIYNSTHQIAVYEQSQIVVAKVNPTITFNNGTLRVGQTLDLSTLFSSNSNGAVTYSITAGDSYATLSGSELTGTAEGSVTVKAEQAETASYNAGEATATITVNPALVLSSIAVTTAPTKTTYNEGETFDPTGMVVTATYTDNSTEAVTGYTWSPDGALATTNTEITISYTENNVTKTTTQAITVNEVVDYATLPFEWDDFSSTPTGITNNSVGSYTSSPYFLKFDGTDDYIILKFNETPGTLTFDIYGNSFSGGTFKVQTSVDGQTYTDLTSYSSLNSTTQSESFNNLGENVRYIKWIYTNKSSGNVALGNIALAAYVAPGNTAPVWSELPTPTIAVNEEYELDLSTLVTGTPTPAISLNTSVSNSLYEFENGLLMFQPTEAGSYEFTFTASNSEGTADATLTVTAAEIATYTLVTSITSGRHYVIAATTSTTTMAMGGKNASKDYYDAIAATLNGNTITVMPNSGIQEFVIVGPNADGYYYIYDPVAGGYLYASSSGSNDLSYQKPNDDNGLWEIDFTENTVTAQGTNSRNLLRYNSGSPRFSCYTSGQTAIAFYEKNESDPQYDFYMDIAAWTVTQTYGENKTDGWYFIASPVNVAIDPEDVENMLTADENENHTYDLYKLSGNTLQNYRNQAFVIANGAGYLYANNHNTTLKFSGTSIKEYNTSSQKITLTHTGWNLIGNPFTFAVSVNTAFAELINGTEVDNKIANSVINPCQGIAVYGDAGTEVTFTKAATQDAVAPSNNNSLQMTLAKTITSRSEVSTKVVDNAVVSFNSNSRLPKFTLLEGNAKLYIPQNGEDYAIAFSNRQGDMPLNFKTTETGNYTISFEGNNMNLRGIYLIDMLAGQEIDLSVNPSYTFIGSPVDKAERFKIVFKNVGSNGEDIFAYQNGNDIIVSGEGELQIFDVTGRSVMTTTISGVETINVPTMGVYIFRLIGSEIKTQKIVVR